MKTMTMDELRQERDKLGSKDLLLDVRGPDEFAEASIDGSKNISHEQVADHADELKGYDRIIIYCRSGRRAEIAFQSLTGSGIDADKMICINEGGMMTWVESGYPTV